MLDYILRELGDHQQFTVIWLHGLGANGHDFEPVVPELNLPPDAGVRFVFPHAPTRPVTINGGMVMRAWYDIVSLEIASEIDQTGIDSSIQQVEELINKEIDNGRPSDRILLAGFSQGGAIALQTGLFFDKPLLGILALSTYLPIPERFDDGDGIQETVPIFMGHGTHDPVVPMQLGRQSYEFLHGRGHPIQWHTYPMEHSVNMDEIRDIGVWMTGLMRKHPLPAGA